MSSTIAPRITIAHDKDGLMFEAYELRRNTAQSIFIDRTFAEQNGGIEKVRGAISPHYMIVMECLQ